MVRASRADSEPVSKLCWADEFVGQEQKLKRIAAGMGLAPADAEDVLGHLLLQAFVGLAPTEGDGVIGADSEALATADALLLIDVGDLPDGDGLGGAPLGAGATGDTPVLPDLRDHVGVLGEFARPCAQTHTDVLDAGADAGAGMAGDVGEGDEGLGVMATGCQGHLLVVLSLDGHLDLFVAEEPVGDDDRSADFVHGEAVVVSEDEVVDGVGSTSTVEGIGLYQERTATSGLDQVDDLADDGRLEVGVVIPFAEVEFDAHAVSLTEEFGEVAGGEEPVGGGHQVVVVGVCREPVAVDLAGGPAASWVHGSGLLSGLWSRCW